MPGPVFLEGDRLTLGVCDTDDYDLLAHHYSNPSVRRQFGDVRVPFSPEAVVAFFDEGQETIHHFIACDDGTPVGHVFLRRVDVQARNGELGYTIFPDHQGKGYATEGSRIILRHGFDGLGLHKIWARVSDHNDASMRVLEKLGFEQEGLLREHFYGFGEYVDEYRFGLLDSEWREAV